MKILNLEPSDYSEKAINIFLKIAQYKAFLVNSDDLNSQLIDANIIITRLKYFINDDFLQKTPKLKAIATATTGLNHIDLRATERRNIKILSLKGENDFLSKITPTAELHWGLLLSVMRFIPQANHAVIKKKIWDRDSFQGNQLYGKTIGIIGYGRLGKIIAKYAKVFGMTILAFDRNVETLENKNDVKFVDLKTLLEKSDVVSIHLSLNEGSKNLLNKKMLLHIKKGAVLINTARGEVIDEQALAELIYENKIAAVATDVLTDEFSNSQNFLENNPLWQLANQRKNIIITPHIGGACPDAMRQTEEFIAEKVSHYILNEKDIKQNEEKN